VAIILPAAKPALAISAISALVTNGRTGVPLSSRAPVSPAASAAKSSAQLLKSLRTNRFTGAQQCLTASSSNEACSFCVMTILTSPTSSSSAATVAVTAA
jgi:hypothetical protein